MNIPLAPVAIFLGTIAMTISGWFATQQTALANRLNDVQSQTAATVQQINDINNRTTRIENKLDRLILQ